MRVLFFGNSYTFRNDLPGVILQMAEDGNPNLSFSYTKVVYGGRTLENHWTQFQSQNILKLPHLTKEDLEQSCKELEVAAAKSETMPEPENKNAGRYRSAIANHRDWMGTVGENAPNWDYVVLQAWRDTEGELDSAYATYTRKFSELARQRGAQVILYHTAPTYQNAEPLKGKPERERALQETRFMKTLAKELNAHLVPVPLAIVTCQKERPDVVLRYINDGHPNQTCGYLTACLFYATLFNQSPEDLTIDRVIDIKIVDPNNPDAGPDGDPRTHIFSDDMRSFLQKTAWNTVQTFKNL